MIQLLNSFLKLMRLNSPQRKKEKEVLKHFGKIADRTLTNTKISLAPWLLMARAQAQAQAPDPPPRMTTWCPLAPPVSIQNKQAASYIDLNVMPHRSIVWPHCYNVPAAGLTVLYFGNSGARYRSIQQSSCERCIARKGQEVTNVAPHFTRQ